MINVMGLGKQFFDPKENFFESSKWFWMETSLIAKLNKPEAWTAHLWQKIKKEKLLIITLKIVIDYKKYVMMD